MRWHELVAVRLGKDKDPVEVEAELGVGFVDVLGLERRGGVIDCHKRPNLRLNALLLKELVGTSKQAEMLMEDLQLA